ncbi:MAG: dephospho-CoA kinase [Oceanospirillaceae bacterium]|nr:dephospho-CoA kinase [Oceanospirillaceae bacterium]|tara:strand:+ start:1804 stop:2406 length:603 start_codon:yes stop_codon:yes gene_type:complete
MTLRIGLTGGIGSGKTAASDYLAGKGIEVVDSDLIAREIVQPEQPAWLAIREHFGAEAILESGELNRPWLRKKVFESPEEKTWLEQQTHPRIRALTITRLEQAQSRYVILASPLLFESSQHQLVDRVLAIDVPEELQILRASQRDQNPADQIRNIIRAQIPRTERLDKADDVADNSGTLSELHTQLDRFHTRYLSLASAT